MLQANQILDLSAIKAILPHRNPVLMLDRVQVVEPNHLIGVKNLSIAEPFFQGHFPGHPIMPGVLQIEAMKQLAEIAVRGELDPANDGDVYLWKLSKAKFRNPNIPADRAKVEITVTGIEDGAASINGTVSNSGGVTCEAQFTLKRRDKSAPTEMPELFNEYDLNDNVDMNNDKIMEVMPHRFPFLLIDYIPENRGENVLAIKNISANEAFFDNMSEDMVVPVSLLCEIGAQAGCASILARPENANKLGYFMSIDGAESFAPVRPGDQLVIRFNLPAGKSRFGKGSGEMLVNGKVVFKVTLMFALVDK
jgi:3-hydroxymyristoyl/3-hydroxydecanoyl-(acyl carrier protein) dehydratase